MAKKNSSWEFDIEMNGERWQCKGELPTDPGEAFMFAHRDIQIDWEEYFDPGKDQQARDQNLKKKRIYKRRAANSYRIVNARRMGKKMGLNEGYSSFPEFASFPTPDCPLEKPPGKLSELIKVEVAEAV